MKGVTSGILLAFLVTYLVTNDVNKVYAAPTDGDDQGGDSAAATQLPLCDVTDTPSGDKTSPSSVAVTTISATTEPSTAVTTTDSTERKRRAASSAKCRKATDPPGGSGVTGLAGSLFGVTAGCILVYLGA